MTEPPEGGKPEPADSSPGTTSPQSGPGQQPQAGQPPEAKQPSAAPPGFMPPPPPAVVEKTKLDLEACRKVVRKLMGNKEAELKEKAQAPGEFKLPAETIPRDRCKKASDCGVSWDSMSGGERLRLCSQCQLFVYDFAGLELAEAEKLVFQRENKENPSFFMRKDGRFLTRNCPVGVKRIQVLTATAAAAVSLVLGILLLLLLAPRPTTEVTVEKATPDLAKGPATNAESNSQAKIDDGQITETAPGAGETLFEPLAHPMPGQAPMPVQSSPSNAGKTISEVGAVKTSPSLGHSPDGSMLPATIQAPGSKDASSGAQSQVQATQSGNSSGEGKGQTGSDFGSVAPASSPASVDNSYGGRIKNYR